MSCLQTKLSRQVATPVKSLNYFKMKKLERTELKNICGGYDAPGGCQTGYTYARVVCNDNFVIDSPNKCANSVGMCNAHGGVRFCACFN